MKPISVQLFSLREQAKADLPKTLKTVADAGYVGVEFAGYYGHDPKDVRKMLDDVGLVASSAHSPIIKAENLAEQVDHAGILGYDYVASSHRSEAWDTADGVRRLAQEYQASAELAKPQGLRVGYHNHWWEMGQIDGQPALGLFYAQAPALLPQIDTYWAANFGAVDVPAFVARWASRTPSLHIKDGPLVQEEPHTAVGAGKMDVPAVVSAADENVLEWLVVEIDRCATDMTTAVVQSARYLIDNGIGQGRK